MSTHVRSSMYFMKSKSISGVTSTCSNTCVTPVRITGDDMWSSHLIVTWSRDMRFPPMWHFDKCRLRLASADSFKAYNLQMMFRQYLNSHKIFKWLAKARIRLRVCAGWSESLLVAHTTLLEISSLCVKYLEWTVTFIFGSAYAVETQKNHFNELKRIRSLNTLLKNYHFDFCKWNEPVHEITKNVVCAISKASDQPAHTCCLIRAFASRLSILWLLSYWLNTFWSV